MHSLFKKHNFQTGGRIEITSQSSSALLTKPKDLKTLDLKTVPLLKNRLLMIQKSQHHWLLGHEKGSQCC